MPQVVGVDHIAITVSDLEATCAFYDRLFGARTHLERSAEGKVQVRQIALGGGALLSVHQAGNVTEDVVPIDDRDVRRRRQILDPGYECRAEPVS